MFSYLTPIAIFRQQIERLREHVPELLDGRLDSIHDARVTTRRIREVLPLTCEWQRRPIVEDLLPRFERMGRSLGRVRDADVRMALLDYLAARIPLAVPSLALARQWAETDRRRLMRKLIKRFDRLGLDLEALAGGAARRRTLFWTALTGSWRHQLRRLIAERARVAEKLQALGTRCCPSAGNFLLMHAGPDAQKRFNALLRAGIIVRPVLNYQLPEHLRVTLGTLEQNDRFLAAWQKILIA